MEKRFKVLHEGLPIMVLIYSNGKYTPYSNKQNTFTTLTEFRSFYYLPEDYAPIVIEIAQSGNREQDVSWE